MQQHTQTALEFTNAEENPAFVLRSPVRKDKAKLKFYRGSKDDSSVVSIPKHRMAIEAILEGFSCPRALTVALLYRYGEHRQLVELEARPEDYDSPHAFRDAYCATKLLSKADFLDLGIDRSAVALDAFFKAEQQCREINRKFRDPAYLSSPENAGNVRLLCLMENEIHRILDGLPKGTYPKDWEDGRLFTDFDPLEWIDSCSWGPGATASITGVDTSAVNKFRNESGITLDLYDLIGPLFPEAFPLWNVIRKGFKPSFEVGSRVLTVPKNAKTDRVIAAEPGLNSFFQLGLGAMIQRRLLRRAGIDLDSQERNGLLAFYASLSGSLATVDFSAASDTISTEVVRELLPPRWFSVLDACRSRYGKVDGKLYRWEKFSSMGNGFTFPLQSLLFFAAAHAVCKDAGVSSDYVGVFGDDVILPSSVYGTFVEFTAFLGFQVNRSKSFSTGYFRESCGVHYLRGLDCKPIYVKTRFADACDILKLANALRRLAHRFNHYNGCRRSFRRAWRLISGFIPKEYRFWIPEGFGDGGFVSNFDEALPGVRRASNWLEGYWVKAIASIGVKRDTEDEALLLARLFTPSRREENNTYSLRRLTRKHIVRFLAARWYNLGPWQ